jgi:hypothetical protein
MRFRKFIPPMAIVLVIVLAVAGIGWLCLEFIPEFLEWPMASHGGG